MHDITRRTFLAGTAGAALVAASAGPLAGRAAAIPLDYDTTFYWNDTLLRAIRSAGGPPTTLSRVAAIMHLAMFDAYTSISDIGTPYVTRYARTPQTTYTVRGTLDQAALTVLRWAFPNQDFTKAAVNAPKGSGPVIEPGPDGFDDIGERAARGVINARAGDGSADTTAYVVQSTVPGQWRPTGSGAAVTPNWGKVRPFADWSGGVPTPPPLPNGATSVSALLASSAYATQVEEVKKLGVRLGSTRNAAQTDIAWFWANDVDGTYKPPGQWFDITKQVSRVRQVSLSGNVQLYARLALALADAAIACWKAKYLTAIDLWRPESAIRLAGTDGNAGTTAVSGWNPLSHYPSVPGQREADPTNEPAHTGASFSPAFPAYVSGHATFGGAWEETMRRFFGTDAVTYTAFTDDPHAISQSRTFTSFSAASAENAISRLYLGVHFRWDAVEGTALGKRVAAKAWSTRLN